MNSGSGQRTALRKHNAKAWRCSYTDHDGERCEVSHAMGEFDEFSLGQSDGIGGAPSVIHIEHLGGGTYFVDIAGICLTVRRDRAGRVTAIHGELQDVVLRQYLATSFTVERTRPLKKMRKRA